MKHLVSLATAVAALQGCATSTQTAVDAEVRRLCAIDGGIRIYETVALPASRFDADGNVRRLDRRDGKGGDEYAYDMHSMQILDSPSVSRLQTRIIRRSDGKVLGVAVRYSRLGGDPPGSPFSSSFTCPESSPIHLDRLVFRVETSR